MFIAARVEGVKFPENDVDLGDQRVRISCSLLRGLRE